MRMYDLFQLAVKTIRGRWAVLPATGVAAGVFCLCFAGAILTAVQQEKALPYELIVSPESNEGIADGDIRKISEIPDVVAVTAVLRFPVNVKTGSYSAQLTLTGIEAEYIQEKFTDGGVFPDNSAMPYIVLNDAARKQFSESEKASGDEAPEIDWLNAVFSLQAGEGGRWIPSKVCGIFSDEGGENTEPAAYISLSAAKELLRNSGQSTNYLIAHVRVSNIGRAVNVSKAITALGFAVTNANAELQKKWDAQIKEMRYLLMLGGLCLICSTVFIVTWKRTYRIEQEPALGMLRWMGMKHRDMGKLYALQSLLLFLIGSAVGIAVSIFLTSFWQY